MYRMVRPYKWDALPWDLTFVHLLWQQKVAHYSGASRIYSRAFLLFVWEALDWTECLITVWTCMGQHSLAQSDPSHPSTMLREAGRICHPAFITKIFPGICMYSASGFSELLHADDLIWSSPTPLKDWTYPGFRYNFPNYTHLGVCKNKKLGFCIAGPVLFMLSHRQCSPQIQKMEIFLLVLHRN